MALLAVLLAAVVAGLIVASGRLNNVANSKGPTTTHRHTTTTVKPVPPPPVTAALAGWGLPVPISQAAVVPSAPSSILVVGGEASNGQTASGAFLVDTATGSLHLDAALTTGVRAASAVVIGSKVVVFGGATTLPVGTVQTFPAPGAPTTATTSVPAVGHKKSSLPYKSTTTTASKVAPTASASGNLPGARAGSAAVSFAGHAYVVGGSNGAAPDGAVMSTTNGISLQTVGSLPVAVRFPAAAVLGDKLYVFGGDTLRPGAKTWSAVDDIQEMDLSNGHAAIIGHLPHALRGAVAVVIDDNIYVAGGSGPAGTNGTVWGFEPQDGSTVAQASLTTPVAYAGAAVLGNKAWLVGGQASNGKLIGSVQTLTVPHVTTTTPTTPVPAGHKALHRSYRAKSKTG